MADKGDQQSEHGEVFYVLAPRHRDLLGGLQPDSHDAWINALIADLREEVKLRAHVEAGSSSHAQSRPQTVEDDAYKDRAPWT